MTRLTGSPLAAMCARCQHEQIAHVGMDRMGPCLAHGCDCRGFAERRRSKYGAERTTVDGVTFDSAAEARYAAELAQEERAGAIRDVERQVRIPLVVNGVKVADYVADFSFTRALTGERVYIDVKGHRTRMYALKRKLVKACTGIEITEVEAR